METSNSIWFRHSSHESNCFYLFPRNKSTCSMRFDVPNEMEGNGNKSEPCSKLPKDLRSPRNGETKCKTKAQLSTFNFSVGPATEWKANSLLPFNCRLSTVDCTQKEINELWLFQSFIMPGDHAQQQCIIRQTFVGQAVIDIDAGFKDAFGTLDWFCLQGGMAWVVGQEGDLAVNFLANGGWQVAVQGNEALS